jgi:acyl dehydratase
MEHVLRAPMTGSVLLRIAGGSQVTGEEIVATIVQRGLYVDEFELGVTYVHSPSRTVTETDNVLFTTLTMNTQSLHLDAEWARTTEFGERLVNSMFTLSALVGTSVAQLPLPASRASMRCISTSPIWPGCATRRRMPRRRVS